jgi:hypothetical protein
MAVETSRSRPSSIGTFLWAFLFFFAFALVVVIWVRSAGPKGGYEDSRAAERLQVRSELEKEALLKLTTPVIVDAEKGIVRLPVADAKRAVLDELKARKVEPSAVKVDPWLPVPVIDPASTEPPTPALPSAPQGADTIRFETAQTAKP